MFDSLTGINYWAFVKYGSYLSMLYLWYKLYKCDREYVRKYFFEKGKMISGKMKFTKYWDLYAEPFIIKEFGIIFTAGNSFIKGLVSDNDDTEKIISNIEVLTEQVKEELESLDKMVDEMDSQTDEEIFKIEM